MKRIFGIEKNIFILSVTSFFNDFSSEMVHSSFPAFFTTVLKSGAQSLGIVEGIADGLANFLKIYSGRMSDKINRRRLFIIIGYSMSVLTRPFYSLSGGIFSVASLRFIDRIGKGVREAPRDVLISKSAPHGEIGKSFGFHRAMDSIGGILGPFAAFLILLYFPSGFNIIFVSAFLVGILAIVSLFFVDDIKSVLSDPKEKISKALKLPKAFKVYVIASFILSIGTIPVAVLLLKTTTLNLSAASIPLFYMVYSLSYSYFSVYAGKLSDMIGTSKVIVTGFLVLILGYVFIIFANSILALVFTFLFLGIFPAMTDGVQRALVAKRIDDEKRGYAYGVLNSALGFGAMIAGIGGGYMWQNFGYTNTLIVDSLIILIGISVFGYYHKVKKVENSI